MHEHITCLLHAPHHAQQRHAQSRQCLYKALAPPWAAACGCQQQKLCRFACQRTHSADLGIIATQGTLGYTTAVGTKHAANNGAFAQCTAMPSLTTALRHEILPILDRTNTTHVHMDSCSTLRPELALCSCGQLAVKFVNRRKCASSGGAVHNTAVHEYSAWSYHPSCARSGGARQDLPGDPLVRLPGR